MNGGFKKKQQSTSLLEANYTSRVFFAEYHEHTHIQFSQAIQIHKPLESTFRVLFMFNIVTVK